MVKRVRKWWMCRKYGICAVHGILRLHGGYGEGKWGLCVRCRTENSAKATRRDTEYESRRQSAIERLNRDWKLPSASPSPLPTGEKNGM